MWGTFKTELGEIRRVRFSPTHVGNMTPREGSATIFQVQPHACGEHSGECYIYCNGDGSAPRMWGTFVASLITQARERFSPTHVGNMHSEIIFSVP